MKVALLKNTLNVLTLKQDALVTVQALKKVALAIFLPVLILEKVALLNSMLNVLTLKKVALLKNTLNVLTLKQDALVTVQALKKVALAIFLPVLARNKVALIKNTLNA